jgi:hypothetical protein
MPKIAGFLCSEYVSRFDNAMAAVIVISENSSRGTRLFQRPGDISGVVVEGICPEK